MFTFKGRAHLSSYPIDFDASSLSASYLRFRFFASAKCVFVWSLVIAAASITFAAASFNTLAEIIAL